MVRGNSLAIYRAECSEKRHESFILSLFATKSNEILNCFTLDLLIKQLLVCGEELSDSALCHQVIFLGRHHGFFEKEINPLSFVQNIPDIPFSSVLQKTVHKLTDPSHWVFRTHFSYIKESLALERVVQNITKKLYELEFTHTLLTVSALDPFTCKRILILGVSDEEDHMRKDGFNILEHFLRHIIFVFSFAENRKELAQRAYARM